MTTALTGKSVTFSYGGLAGAAQITQADISESATSNTIQTLGGSVAISQGSESEITCSFLYDGEQSAGFYEALKGAFDAATSGALVIVAGVTSGWDGDALVTALSVAMPADDAMTCDATFTVSGALTFASPLVP